MILNYMYLLYSCVFPSSLLFATYVCHSCFTLMFGTRDDTYVWHIFRARVLHSSVFSIFRALCVLTQFFFSPLHFLKGHISRTNYMEARPQTSGGLVKTSLEICIGFSNYNTPIHENWRQNAPFFDCTYK